MVLGKPYDLAQFQIDTTSYGEFCRYLLINHALGRGMPTEPAEYAQAMRALLLDGSIHHNDAPPEIASCLLEAYKRGYVNKNTADQYTFPSPLHQQLWSWQLLPQTNYEIPHKDLISFVKEAVALFNPSQLSLSDRSRLYKSSTSRSSISGRILSLRSQADRGECSNHSRVRRSCRISTWSNRLLHSLEEMGH